MEMRSHFFSEQIAEIIEEIIKDFEESNPDDPIKWFKDAVKRHCLLNDEETERVSKELLKGIVSYKKAKKTLVKRIVSVHKIFSQTFASTHIKQI